MELHPGDNLKKVISENEFICVQGFDEKIKNLDICLPKVIVHPPKKDILSLSTHYCGDVVVSESTEYIREVNRVTGRSDSA